MNLNRAKIERRDEAVPLGNENMGGLLFDGDKQI